MAGSSRLEQSTLVGRWSIQALFALGTVVLAACVTDDAAKVKVPGSEVGLSEEQVLAQRASLDVVARLEVTRAGPRSLAPFMAAAQPEPIRLAAVRALGRLEHIESTDLLFQATGDESPAVRAEAAFGLGQLDLAFATDQPKHEGMRSGVEQLLTFLLAKEKNQKVRTAVVRALGRVSARKGLKRLLVLARHAGPDRVAALYALGVAGSRREASLKEDVDFAEVASAGLASDDVATRRAAAYATFRQKIPLPNTASSLLMRPKDAQTTIHLLRALSTGAGPAALAEPAIKHDDWRVRAEAVRVLAKMNPVPTQPLLEALNRALAALNTTGVGAEAHVVSLACKSLVNAPFDATRPAFLRATSQLRDSRPDAGCACAVAHDAQQARFDQIKVCAPRTGKGAWSDERRRRLGVAVASSSMISSREKAAWLKSALHDQSPRVRLDAANALAQEGTLAAAEAALAAIPTEGDPPVAGALLGALRGEHEKLITTRTLANVVDRFLPAKTIETAEPLLQAGRLLKLRTGRAAASAIKKLRRHTILHVRLTVSEIKYGERPHGPIAIQLEPIRTTERLPPEAILITDRGEIRIVFEREIAPVTVRNFVQLAQSGVLDGTPFHRLVPDFVAQGGDPGGNGSGGPGYTIACENNDAGFARGAVGMALAGKDTGGSQFFLTQSEQPHLDGRYTLFARVVSGFAVMDALGPDDRLLSVRISPGS